MGRIFVVDLEGRTYRCKFCKTHLALADELVSRSFHCRRGKAYLFNNAVNITYGPHEERMMLSGMHTVADIFCCCCGQIVGWKYRRNTWGATRSLGSSQSRENHNEFSDSLDLQGDSCTAVARQLHGDCTAVARLLHGRRTAVARLLHGRSTAAAQRLHGSCTATARHTHGGCTAEARRLHGYCTAEALQLHSDCTAVARLLHGRRTAVARKLHARDNDKLGFREFSFLDNLEQNLGDLVVMESW
ncbi:hypothetical protein RD792_000260 [Penstemon davidsonii]|uniref:Yippee domain-containing protein n=1 Tax=Penstemon davidsonii TaxID=160366 RepID=A0ABR0DUL7_9LAMI|nr:hypothetical protein RD792_000260 [Penstemon davidsonii]